MQLTSQTRCTAFEGDVRVAFGALPDVVRSVKESGRYDAVLIFDDETSELIEVDFRGRVAEVLKRLAARLEPADPEPEGGSARRPGRPKLGVVAREVTLLPRHWEWLNGQPGGASVALRKLVEEARRAGQEKDRVRRVQESTYRFMAAMAGNQPGFEEASRALFAGNEENFRRWTRTWPADVRNHARKLAGAAFTPAEVPA